MGKLKNEKYNFFLPITVPFFWGGEFEKGKSITKICFNEFSHFLMMKKIYIENLTFNTC